MLCDVCGEELMNRDGTIAVGKQISLLGANPAREKVEILFGKNKFNICYVCVLKSLGVKELKPAESHA